MIRIPPNIQILATIKTGSVYYCKDDELSSPESHYFVVLNKDPRRDPLVILAVASSQVQKRKDNIKKLGLPQNTLVVVSPSEYSHFSKDTVFDCNRLFEKTREALIDRLEQKKLKVCGNMPAVIVGKIIEGALASPEVSRGIKKALRKGD